MAEFDDKLNSLLSNPDAMSQIMKLAQSLSNDGTQQAPPPPPPPPSSAPPPAGSNDLFSMLTGGAADPSLMMKLLPLIQELSSQDSHARQLLYALKPYLKEERQAKIERALQLAKLFQVGKKFLAGQGD